MNVDPHISGNLFTQLLVPETGEKFTTLLHTSCVHIERIVSSDTPESQLYDQAQDEWVCLLQGRAQLWVDGTEITLTSGDYCFIPAHTPHRVLSTSTTPPCLWLAVHIQTNNLIFHAVNDDR